MTQPTTTPLAIGQVRMRGIVPVTVAGFLFDGLLVQTDEPNDISFPGTTGIRRGTVRADEISTWPLAKDEVAR